MTRGYQRCVTSVAAPGILSAYPAEVRTQVLALAAMCCSHTVGNTEQRQWSYTVSHRHTRGRHVAGHVLSNGEVQACIHHGSSPSLAIPAVS